MALIEKMSEGLGVPIPLIEGIARKASHAYKTYTIPKRRGGRRTIHHPSKELKGLQRWLVYNVITAWPVHDAACAYREQRSIKDNASQHVHSRYLLRLDLKDFFPSITAEDVLLFLTREAPQETDWTGADQKLFVRLVCRLGHLSIGAPTSPSLSNAICFNLDARLANLAAEHSTTYTRYADDLFFSTSRPNTLGFMEEEITKVLDALDCPANLQLRVDKTRHSSKRGRRQVTGLVLGSDGTISIGRDRKRFIRRQIYRIPELNAKERAQLAGLIAFAISIEPDFINALVLKYGHSRVEAARKGEGVDP